MSKNMYKDSRNKCTSVIKTKREGSSNTNPDKKKIIKPQA